MVQSTDLRDGDDVIARRRFDFARRRGIALQRQMRPAVVIVVEVRREDPLQVPIMEHDNPDYS